MERNLDNEGVKPTLDELLDQSNKEYVKELLKKGLDRDAILECVDEKISAETQMLIDTAGDQYFQQAKECLDSISMRHRKAEADFAAHLEQLWGKGFAASETLYQLATAMARDYRAYVVYKVKKSEYEQHVHTYTALVYINARMCQTYFDVLCLIKNGFADAAQARWRTMHELEYISYFIETSNEETAQAYIEQRQTDTKIPLWAKKSPYFKDKSANFKPDLTQIAKCCKSTKDWDQQFRVGCFVTHGSPQGTFGRLAIPKGHDYDMEAFYGKTDYGIVEPAVNSAIVLAKNTMRLITYFPNVEGVARCKFLGMWVDLIRESYLTAERDLFESKDEEQL